MFLSLTDTDEQRVLINMDNVTEIYPLNNTYGVKIFFNCKDDAKQQTVCVMETYDYFEKQLSKNGSGLIKNT